MTFADRIFELREDSARLAKLERWLLSGAGSAYIPGRRKYILIGSGKVSASPYRNQPIAKRTLAAAIDAIEEEAQ